MSPEQTEGAAEVNHLTDIWAMGVIMYWALTGKNPFSGPTLAATLMNVAKGDAPSLVTLTPHLPPQLIEVVARCLKRDPAHRWQSAQALSDALGPFENLDAGVFTPMHTGGTMASTGAVPAPTASPAGGTIASAPGHPGHPSGPAAPASGAPTWSNQIAGSPQAAPTLGAPASWTVNEEFGGRPESLSGGGHGILIGVVAVIVLALLTGAWVLFKGSSGGDDDVVVADAADAGTTLDAAVDGDDDAASGEDDGESTGAQTSAGEPAAEAEAEADDGAATGEAEGGGEDDGAADDAAAAGADDGAGEGDDGAGAGDDGAGDDAAADDGGTKPEPKPKPKPKPKPLRLVASKSVRTGVTHAQAKAHCSTVKEHGASWKLPTEKEAHLLGRQNGWLSSGMLWSANTKRAMKVMGTTTSRAVCVARVRL
jgi:hypothetical protein